MQWHIGTTAFPASGLGAMTDCGPWFHGSESNCCHVFGLFIVYNKHHVFAKVYIYGHPAEGQ